MKVRGIPLPLHEANDPCKIPNTESQRDEAPALDGTDAGKTPSLLCSSPRTEICRTRVRFTGFRVRPLDPDNFAGSVKDLLDGLRHAHLIEGDEWWRIELTTAQEKVKSYAEERTVIEIEW